MIEGHGRCDAATAIALSRDIARRTTTFESGCMYIGEAQAPGAGIDTDAWGRYPYRRHDLRPCSGALIDVPAKRRADYTPRDRQDQWQAQTP